MREREFEEAIKAWADVCANDDDPERIAIYLRALITLVRASDSTDQTTDTINEWLKAHGSTRRVRQ